MRKFLLAVILASSFPFIAVALNDFNNDTTEDLSEKKSLIEAELDRKTNTKQITYTPTKTIGFYIEAKALSPNGNPKMNDAFEHQKQCLSEKLNKSVDLSSKGDSIRPMEMLYPTIGFTAVLGGDN